MALDPNEPVGLDAAKLHLRVDTDDQDSAIEGYILAARRRIETRTGHILLRREVTRSYASFDAVKVREFPIVLDEALALEYLDAASASQTFTDFRLSTATRPGRLYLASGATWPGIATADDAVTLTFTAGYEDPDAVPAEFKEAILLLVGHFFEARATAEPAQAVQDAVDYLLVDYRLPALA